jgi:hypothetical protein
MFPSRCTTTTSSSNAADSLAASNLKGKGDPFDDQSRDRDHQDQKRPWKKDGAKEGPSLEQNDQSG